MSEQYLVIIREPEFDPATVSEELWNATMEAHGAFRRAVAAAGAEVLDVGGLAAAEAVVVEPARNGQAPVFTDRPFAQSKEVNHGFYKLAVRDAAQARELAALIPTGGRIELYPVSHHTEYPSAG